MVSGRIFFRNLAIDGDYTVPVALDHQGHILPKNVLGAILDPIARSAFAQRPNDINALNAFLTQTYPGLHFDAVTNYINFVLLPNCATPDLLVDTNQANMESWLGGYSSVIMWNPVDICRAPMDGRRGGTWKYGRSTGD